MASREDHEAAGDATAEGDGVIFTERLRDALVGHVADLPPLADVLPRLSTAQLGHLGEAIGKGFAEASGCKPHAMHGGGGFADKVAGAIRAGFETLASRMPTRSAG